MLSAIPPNFSPPLCFFCDRPLTPPPLLASHGIKWDGPAGTDQHKVDCPTLSGFSVCGEGRVAAKGSLSGVTEQKQKHCVARQSTGFLLAPSLYLDLVQGKKNPTHQCDFDRNIPTVRVCVSVCAPSLDICTRARKKKANNTAERQATNAAAVISSNTHTHTVFCPVFS